MRSILESLYEYRITSDDTNAQIGENSENAKLDIERYIKVI